MLVCRWLLCVRARYVAIENGLLQGNPEEDGEWNDVAVVSVCDGNGTVATTTSCGVPVVFDGSDLEAYEAQYSVEEKKDMYVHNTGGALTREEVVTLAVRSVVGRLWKLAPDARWKK